MAARDWAQQCSEEGKCHRGVAVPQEEHTGGDGPGGDAAARADPVVHTGHRSTLSVAHDALHLRHCGRPAGARAGDGHGLGGLGIAGEHAGVGALRLGAGLWPLAPSHETLSSLLSAGKPEMIHAYIQTYIQTHIHTGGAHCPHLVCFNFGILVKAFLRRQMNFSIVRCCGGRGMV